MFSFSGFARAISQSPPHGQVDLTVLEVASPGESSVADKCGGDCGEGEEVFGLVLVPAVEPA